MITETDRTQASPTPTRVLTVQETLRRLKISRTRLWDLRRAGKIRSACDDGGRVFIDEDSVEHYLAALFERDS